MYNIVVHSSNPRLKDSCVCEILPKRDKPSLIGKTDFYLVTLNDFTYYEPIALTRFPLRRKPKYVPRKVNKFVDTGVVAKKREIVDTTTTYTSKYNEFTGELRVVETIDTDRYRSGLYLD